MILDLERLRRYPEGSNSYPPGYQDSYAELVKLGEEAGYDVNESRQIALDSINQEHYENVKKAFETISRDVNGNDGMALARLFATEHPELQHMWFDALRAGFLLTHKELGDCVKSGIYYVETQNLDGRVRRNDAEFAVGRELEWR